MHVVVSPDPDEDGVVRISLDFHDFNKMAMHFGECLHTSLVSGVKHAHMMERKLRKLLGETMNNATKDLSTVRPEFHDEGNRG